MRLTQKHKSYLAKLLSDRVCFTLPEQFNNIIDNKEPNTETKQDIKEVLEEMKSAMYLLDQFVGTDKAKQEYNFFHQQYKQWLKSK